MSAVSPSFHVDDKELVAQAVSGDEAAFAELVRRYTSCVWAVCLSYMHNPSECEDVAQEVFTKAYTRLDGLREGAAFGPWIAQIARRTCLSSIRSKSRYASAILRYTEFLRISMSRAEYATAHAVECSDDISVLHCAIQKLPPKSREAVYLHNCEGYSVRDAAALMGISYSAAIKRIAFARDRLQKEIGAERVDGITELRASKKLRGSILSLIPYTRISKGIPSAVNASDIQAHHLARHLLSSATRPRAMIVIVTAIGIIGGFVLYQLNQPSRDESSRGAEPNTVLATATSDSVIPEARQGTPSRDPEPAAQPESSVPTVQQAALVPSTAPQQARVIRGRVYDADTGFGLGDVKVTAYLTSRLYEVRHTATTDASGSFEIADLPGDEYEVRRGDVVGYPSPVREERQIVSVSSLDDSFLSIEVPVSKGLSLSGVVVDPAGTPLQGIRVRGYTGAAAPLRDATSGEDGSFELLGLAATPSLYLSAEAENYLSELGEGFPFDQSLRGVRIVAFPTTTLAGRVVDANGQPASAIYVVARPSGDTYFSGGRSRNVQTDAVGTFSLTGVGIGEHSLFAQHTDPRVMNDPDDYPIHVQSGNHISNLTLVLHSGYSISGRIVNDAGEAIANAQVQWTGPAQGVMRSDTNGRYMIDALPYGSYRVYSSHSNYASALLSDVQVGTVDADIALGEYAAVRGQIVNESTGLPIQHFEILLTSNPVNRITPSLQSEFIERHDTTGEFEFVGVPRRSSTLVVQASGFATAWIALTPGSDSQDSENSIIALQPGASLEGEIRIDEIPVPHQDIFVSQKATNVPGFIVKTDASGRFKLDGLVAGPASVYAKLADPDYFAQHVLRDTIELQASQNHQFIFAVSSATQ